mmetsp:Transcript_2578/g.5859  ORF Transcript_2578/g.5859 Transcript_2578/m.5859 type:complete len:265 (-) Transcript_2578:597-1391(-)|eukprot:CAMPEP_0204911440 /NCGR_PEP_ID=MMETSP1397-20131031/9786_1 /ASSEMBLY_ACC=CAM_ASM_000891 /TAXON_ID=49980 /ORGANISM="Climacostomum Climacostomum virens, Strain Stock W-24" /LENGTH=264 /DNA_ID=CAMNT_0052081995 /DNA_START=683 /DNA_END=1477 /DNA_ORIENTATION=+
MLEPKTLLQTTELSELLREVKVKLIDCSLEQGDTIAASDFLNWHGKPDRVLGCMEALEVKQTNYVVCFCSFGIEEAAQVWWILKQLDFTHVSVLNGGLKAWREAQLPVTKSVQQKAEPSRIVLPEVEGLIIEAPEHFVLLDSDESVALVKNLLNEAKQLKPTSQLNQHLEGFSDRAVAVTGGMAGTVLLALFITGHSELAWQLGDPCRLPRPTFRSWSERQSTGSDYFEVVELNRDTLNTSFNDKIPSMRDGGQSSSSCSCHLI